MRRVSLIVLLMLSCSCYMTSELPHAYMDDSYYWPEADTLLPIEPKYDSRARELVFLQDTVERNDTVLLRIVLK